MATTPLQPDDQHERAHADPSWDVAIIGAGAAGLMAAIAAGRAAHEFSHQQQLVLGATKKSATSNGLRIIALDGAKKLGAKILVAGGGRCNVTNQAVNKEDFNGSSRNAIAKVLRSFTVPQTLEFFAQLGVEMKLEPSGKYFPQSDEAKTVLDALLHAATEAGVILQPDCRVESIAHFHNNEIDPSTISQDDRFILQTSRGELRARAVILATGGKSLPKTGSDGAGYELAKTLGHSITKTTPALVPLLLEEGDWLTELSGIALDVELSLHDRSDKIKQRCKGAMLFTHFGLSGPVVLDMSRHWIAANELDPQSTLRVNYLPDLDFAGVEKRMLDFSIKRPVMTVLSFLREHFPERMAQGIIKVLDIESNTIIRQFSRERRKELIHLLTAMPLLVVRDRGYLFAEVTAGGVPLSELNTATMASRLCPGLWLCGEIVDVDGRIGGFNFQWAWCTGRLAGQGAVKSLTADV